MLKANCKHFLFLLVRYKVYLFDLSTSTSYISQCITIDITTLRPLYIFVYLIQEVSEEFLCNGCKNQLFPFPHILVSHNTFPCLPIF